MPREPNLSRLAPIPAAYVFAFVLFLTSARPLCADPSPPTAGSEESRFKEEAFLKELPGKYPKASIVEREREKPEADRKVKFRLNEVRFSGNKMIPSTELWKAVKSILHREVTFQDVQEAVSCIKRLYREKGYVAVYVYVPPQNVREGALQINVLEGVLEDLRIADNKHFSSELLRGHFGIQPGETIRYDNFKGDLVRLNKHRDIDATAVLKPGEATGTTDILVQVKDRSPFHLSADVNNLGTRSTGKYRYGLSASHTNFLGKFYEVSARFQAGKSASAGGADLNVPLNGQGTRAGFGVTHADIQVGGEFQALGIKGNSTTYSPYFLHPIYESESSQMTFKGGFDWRSVENKVLGIVSGRDELRILNVGVNIEATDSSAQIFSSQTMHFGFDGFLGASGKVDRRAIRTGTGGQFLIYRGSYIRYQRLPYETMLSIRGSWQVTPDRLPASEQFRLGGAHSVRGYQEGEFMGDTGGFGSLEFSTPLLFMPANWRLPFSEKSARKQIQWVSFFDFGAAGIRKTLIGEKKDRFLAGIGTGLRVHLYEKLYARLEWGFPLASTPVDRRSSAFYFGVSNELL